MKIAVIAASGRSGQAFVRLALAQGHSIRAGIHRNAPFTNQTNLEIISCDATKPEDIRTLIEGQDAVVSFIGHVWGSAAHVQRNAIQAAVVAMKEQGITRIVSLTGTGVRQPGDQITIMDKILNASIGIIDPKRIQDGKDHVAVLTESGLEWTIIRVLKLQNTRPQPYVLTSHGPTKLITSRDEVAQATLEVLEHHTFVREMPIISKPQGGA